ncbi:unnamed protein product [Vitrella brassicaformis CCMP3155]|uniref:Uncharacterized protein n=1 Tax=Vitrella brassicaformis (strain CCMP3155) TaxID=1169540 RepID=A0A0G4G7X3_VITBC|nr:unnamed protein product [Vitrella brassicaformis CCMP3155]|eukprot:CEM24759.1 unnamed protein product [Vitrella brassicaformis CCMP3155]
MIIHHHLPIAFVRKPFLTSYPDARGGPDAAALVHGNGGGKALLGYLSNYEAGAWTEENGSLWHMWHLRDDESPYVQPTLVLAVVCNDRN